MGIILDQAYTTKQGVVLSNAYLSFGAKTLRVTKTGDDAYIIKAIACVYPDKQARLDGKRTLETLIIRASVTKAQLAEDHYDHVYTELKTRYPGASDDLP